MSKLNQPRPVAPRETIEFARKSFHGTRAVGSFLPALTSKAFQKYGFSAASLITEWSSIVGSELARYAVPERLKWPRVPEQTIEETPSAAVRRTGAVLVVRVDGARALDVQYRARQIIDRINAYFGYAAVAEIRLMQALVPPEQPRRPPSAKAEPLAQEVAGIPDARLRDALARLGAEIRAAR